MNKNTRPLSPHLQIHKPLLTMLFSITHRISAIVFFSSLTLIGLWISSFYFQENFFNFISLILNSFTSKILILLWLICVNHFILNEFKHLLWSQTRMMEIKIVYGFSYFILLLNFLLTCLVGAIIF
ncbi:succinate dehydrogenase, cytochrome b556 subunit [Alphaproteobacteria bacterium]|nr:succinate dehydrogenase, cytochrome b556 subunit [Alphaproteobacteria bacterium]